jgi:hypothetical protein
VSIRKRKAHLLGKTCCFLKRARRGSDGPRRVSRELAVQSLYSARLSQLLKPIG